MKLMKTIMLNVKLKMCKKNIKDQLFNFLVTLLFPMIY